MVRWTRCVFGRWRGPRRKSGTTSSAILPATNRTSSACGISRIPASRGETRRGLLCAVGLVLFPYYLPLSIHVYTDVPAALFVLLGFWLYARQQPVWSAVAFALGIATRQYMVLFPAALAWAELAPALFARGEGGRWRPSLAPARWKAGRTVPLGLAVASLLGWFLFFGGLGPQAGTEDWPRHNVSLGGLEPGYALYFLTCLGVYFLGYEILLFRRWGFARELLTPRSLALAPVVLALYVVFSPINPETQMGPINRLALWVFPPAVLGSWSEGIRVVLYAALAWATCVRFARMDLVLWLLLASATLMLASFEAWEKYNLTILVVLWYLRSLSDLERPLDLWTTCGRAQAGGRPGYSR